MNRTTSLATLALPFRPVLTGRKLLAILGRVSVF